MMWPWVRFSVGPIREMKFSKLFLIWDVLDVRCSDTRNTGNSLASWIIDCLVHYHSIQSSCKLYKQLYFLRVQDAEHVK